MRLKLNFLYQVGNSYYFSLSCKCSWKINSWSFKLSILMLQLSHRYIESKTSDLFNFQKRIWRISTLPDAYAANRINMIWVSSGARLASLNVYRCTGSFGLLNYWCNAKRPADSKHASVDLDFALGKSGRMKMGVIYYELLVWKWVKLSAVFNETDKELLPSVTKGVFNNRSNKLSQRSLNWHRREHRLWNVLASF